MPLLAPYLSAVINCSHGTNDLESIVSLCEKGSSQLWVALRDSEPVGAFVTELIRYPRKTVCRVWTGGGHIESVLALLPDVEAYARQEGCSQILAEGPEFIRDKLGEYFEVARVVMIREV